MRGQCVCRRLEEARFLPMQARVVVSPINNALSFAIYSDVVREGGSRTDEGCRAYELNSQPVNSWKALGASLAHSSIPACPLWVPVPVDLYLG